MLEAIWDTISSLWTLFVAIAAILILVGSHKKTKY